GGRAGGLTMAPIASGGPDPLVSHRGHSPWPTHATSRQRPRQQNGDPMSERTLILVKPDGVERGLVGDVLARIERKGYVLEQLQLLHPTQQQLAAHYEEHQGKPFYQ